MTAIRYLNSKISEVDYTLNSILKISSGNCMALATATGVMMPLDVKNILLILINIDNLYTISK